MVTLYSLTEAQTPLPSMATAMGVLCAGGPIGTAAGQLGAGLLGATPAFVIVPTAAALGLAASIANTRTFSGRSLDEGATSTQTVNSDVDAGTCAGADIRSWMGRPPDVQVTARGPPPTKRGRAARCRPSLHRA